MTVKLAINGFGRIGRLVLRSLTERQSQGDLKNVEIVAINDLGGADQGAYLFQYDSVHGTFPELVHHTEDSLDVGRGPIPIFCKKNPEELPWKKHHVDVVLECSGHFTSAHKAQAHLKAGAHKVLISAPAEDVDVTVVYGVNHQILKPHHHIVSNASCTTNCLAPLVFALNKEIGIEHGFMTTIHAYTGDQSLVDSFHKDPRRARAASLSMIPTSTGAAKAVGLVLPEMKGKLDGTAIRVPTPNVSVVDLKFVSTQQTSIQEINSIFETYAVQSLKGILGICKVPLVSCDFNHSSFSSIADLTQTQVVGETFCRVLSWYDNEWGFANRMVDTALAMAVL